MRAPLSIFPLPCRVLCLGLSASVRSWASCLSREWERDRIGRSLGSKGTCVVWMYLTVLPSPPGKVSVLWTRQGGFCNNLRPLSSCPLL
jgi:hypothetical protein